MESPTATLTKRAAKRTNAQSSKKAPAKAKATAAAKPQKQPSPSDQWRKVIARSLDENKAEDISELNLKEKCSFTDFMVVASGRSARHVASLADHVIDDLRKAGGSVMSVEGKDTGDWVLIDAGDVVVHIFRPEIRQFYNIEKMWAIPLTTS
jgi:ribosome-associated protein